MAVKTARRILSICFKVSCVQNSKVRCNWKDARTTSWWLLDSHKPGQWFSSTPFQMRKICLYHFPWHFHWWFERSPRLKWQRLLTYCDMCIEMKICLLTFAFEKYMEYNGYCNFANIPILLQWRFSWISMCEPFNKLTCYLLSLNKSISISQTVCFRNSKHKPLFA